ncbi:MAG: hypothetical protein AAF571_13585 [Verrucomicrobiota bacterium]
MITKSLLGLMVASVAVAGTAGYFVGKSSSGYDSPGATISSSDGASANSRLNSGYASDTGAASDSNRSTLTRLSLGKVSDTSWHLYTGPFTAESWMAIRQAVLGASLDDVQQTLAKLAELPISQERLELQRELLAMWATRDPLAALEFAGGIEMREERNDAREDILKVWAGREPREAFEWLEAQREVMPSSEYNRLFDDAIRGYADLSLSEAINYFNTLSDTLDRRQSRSGINEIVESMIQQGKLADAASFIDQFNDPEIQQQVSEELISELAEVDVQQALGLLEDYTGSENYISMQTELVEQWARNDPAQAADYITNTVAVGDGFSDMASQVMRNWDDLAAASEWLSQYDPSPELDRPTMTLVFRASREDPAGAISWAGSVTDDRMQNRALSAVASNWKASDEAAVSEYLAQNSELTPEQVKIIQDAPARSYGGRGWGRR